MIVLRLMHIGQSTSPNVMPAVKGMLRAKPNCVPEVVARVVAPPGEAVAIRENINKDRSDSGIHPFELGPNRYWSAICASPFPKDQSIRSFSVRITITSCLRHPNRASRFLAISA